MNQFKTCAALLIFAVSVTAQDRPKKYEQVKWFLPSTAKVGQWGEIPERQGMVKFIISEVTGKNEAILIEEKRTIDPNAGRRGAETTRTKFVLIGRKTDEMISGRQYDMVGDLFKAVGTRKIGSQSVIVIEPFNEADRK